MKTASFAFLLFMTAAAFAQIPAEKPVFENYVQRSTPRFIVSEARAAAPEYEPAYKHIKPPLEDVHIAKTNRTIDNVSGEKITYSSGTSISIPANAFVDENGNTVNGNVTIGWREFKNPVDFLLSGIPMSYKDGQGINQFASAGMFEITASVQGKEVFLRDGEKIDVRMASMDESPDYNLYAFNDNSGAWEMKADKKNVAVSKTRSFSYTPAVIQYMYSIDNGSHLKWDSSKFAERFNSMDYRYTRRSDSRNTEEYRQWWKAHAGAIKISAIRKTHDGHIIFRIARTVGSNRELVAYQFTTWKTDSSMDLMAFYELAGIKNKFFDARIQKTGEQYTILLKGVKGFKEIKAVPVKWNAAHETEPYSDQTKEKLYARYARILSDRGKYFDKQLASGKIAYNYYREAVKGKPMEAWKTARRAMNEKEKEMAFEEWKEYADDLKKQEVASIETSEANSSNIIRSFSIDGMGVWNCDQIKRLANPVEVAAKYTGEDGRPLRASATFIVDKKLNGVLQYYSDNIAFSKTTETVLIAILEGGGIGVTLPEYFKGKNFAKNRSCVFPVQELGAGAASVSDLKKLTGL